ncbi:MAG: protease HtpX [Granulosicoccus sp.]|nr:protease HtpX [Granulosicoccus sp.]
MTRILLFLATNMAVMVVFSIITSIFGLDRAIGQSTTSLVIYASLFGFVGSFISLAMSKSSAIRAMNVHVIDQPTNETERWLLETVHAQAREADIGLPDVGIFQQSAPNAFATGWNKNDSLVAVSTGLLQSMSREEVEAVLGHEVAHVYNGDMVTMGLIQGVLNTFVIVFSRILGSMIDNAMRGNRGGGGGYGPGFFLGNIIGNVVFGFLASLIAAWFSRQREFRADAGGAMLAGRSHMIGALEALKRGSPAESALPEKLQAFGITGGHLAKFLSTHPPLDERIARLRAEA